MTSPRYNLFPRDNLFSPEMMGFPLQKNKGNSIPTILLLYAFLTPFHKKRRKKLGNSFRKYLPALKFDQNYFYLEIEEEKVDISKVKSKYFQNAFV